MQVEYMSFSAHADAKGIMQLIRQAEPRNVLLVHGEAKKMEFLKQKIEQEFRKYSAGAEEGMAAGGRRYSSRALSTGLAAKVPAPSSPAHLPSAGGRTESGAEALPWSF